METNEFVIADFSEAATASILSACIDQGGIGAVPGIYALVLVLHWSEVHCQYELAPNEHCMGS